MEQTANMLSPHSKPIVVATSPTRIFTYPPGGHSGRDWLRSARVGHGAFTVEADKVAIGPYLRQLIAARKALALSEGDMDLYRTLHAATLWLLDGCEVAMPPEETFEEEETVDDWLATMRFDTAKDKALGSGLTPLHFAVMTGRVDLVEALLDGGAAVDASAEQAVAHIYVMKGFTPLFLAGVFARNGAVIICFFAAVPIRSCVSH